MRGLIGQKLGMTQVFDHNGDRIPVTVVKLGPCTVVQKKNENGIDGYGAVVLGFGDIAVRKLNKPTKGRFDAAGVKPTRVLKEFRMPEHFLEEVSVGDELTANLFQAGEYVDVVGTSKGCGFAGVMKRHNFSGAKRTHGVHEAFRHPGSIGMAAYPGRVMKGTKLPGQMGDARVTIQNLQIVAVDADENLVMLKGAVPGANEGIVYVTAARKKIAKSA